ncbi:family 20 glycosylhydrolase [bacterium]|nr:family 20 glycosylhydrolase [bacterium]
MKEYREPILLPRPRGVVLRDGWCDIPADLAGRIDPAWARRVKGGGAAGRVAIVLDGGPGLSLGIDETARPQGYRLEVAPGAISVAGHDHSGIFYGLMTLRQLARLGRETGRIPAVVIEDWPDLAVRGAMLDVSRDRVPTMERLLETIDTLAGLKVNQIQLYMEHAFAYERHQIVWQDASPLTAKEIRIIDAFCHDRFIELIPNQNSFGHMERWLLHDPYNELAELPDKAREKFAGSRSLCPIDDRVFPFLEELYDELLPNFASRRFNVGLDETFDLGKGRSREACERLGSGRVYLEYLKKVYELVRRRGHRMQFWADIILNYPELLPELPHEWITVLIWGYEANHPFDEQCRRLRQSGLPFCVSPGTSSWNALIGRTANMRANVLGAARAAEGSMGLLMTDWGDNGHWQHPPSMWPGFALGAAVAWSLQANENIDLAAALDAHVFEPKSGHIAAALLDLGDAYLDTGVLIPNATIFGQLLIYPERPISDERWSGLSAIGLEAAMHHIEQALHGLAPAAMQPPAAALAVEQIRHNAAMALHACRQGLARIAAGKDGRIEDVPAAARARLAGELEPLIEEHRRLWLADSRPGGLADSAGRLEKLVSCYRLA